MWKVSVLLALCKGNPPVTVDYPDKGPATPTLMLPNRRFNKQSGCRWTETPGWSLWRHCNAIKNFRESAPGHDEVTVSILEMGLPITNDPLVFILNMSVSLGIMPTGLKIANVLPLYKAGDLWCLTSIYIYILFDACNQRFLKRWCTLVW